MDDFAVIKWFEEVGKDDVARVGGKGANLGELTSHGVSVPPGFCVTASAYTDFIRDNGLDSFIADVIGGIDFGDNDSLNTCCSVIRGRIMASPVSESTKREVVRAYEALGVKVGTEEVEVAVRSSATAEDLPDASFAGQQDTYLHIRGASGVLEHVKRCWASLWTARATYYRQSMGYDHFEVSLSAVVQVMVESAKAGVMFTVNPVTGRMDQIMIEASWGLGEAVVSGAVTPDEFLLSKNNLEELETIVADKTTMVVPRKEGMGTESVSVGEYLGAEFVSMRCMSHEDVRYLGEQGLAIERLYGRPMDVEWAQDKGSGGIYILQARPVTTVSASDGASGVVVKACGKEVEKAPNKGVEAIMNDKVSKGGSGVNKRGNNVLVRGLAASPGIAKGRIVHIRDMDEISRIKDGDILVTQMTNPDMVPAMKKVLAVITDEGGRTCHAAIVSRELGIPCIVGAKNATSVLKEGAEVTVDATRGVVYEGSVNLSSDEDKHSPVGQPPASAPTASSEAAKDANPAVAAVNVITEAAPVTGTKIYMNLGDASIVGKYKHLPFDGIGLMRTEFIFSHLGVHPMHLVKTGRGEVLIEAMSEAVSTVAQAVYPRPVVVRLSDFRTNEFRGLEGGNEVEPVENNPMIGWRGVSRYISPLYEEGFRLECRAIKRVRDQYGLINVWVMLPFVRTTWELATVKEIMASEGLVSNKSFKIWIMAEVPSVVFAADEFASMVDGFSIGSNDLTQLIMGVDRDSGILNNMGYFDERDVAVQRAIKILIEAAHRHGITCSICGQGPSLYPDFTEFLVDAGIDSVSVNPDTVGYTRQLVASVEQRVILRGMRKSAN